MASGLVSSLLSSASSLLAILRRPPSSSYPRSDHRTVSVDLQRLERLLSRIQATLDDAEEQEVQDNYVKLWLTELKDLARDADDLLDDYRYELLQRQVQEREADCSRKRKHMDDDNEDDDSIKEVSKKMKLSDLRLITEYGVANFLSVQHLSIEKCHETSSELLCSTNKWLPCNIRFLQFSFCSFSGALDFHNGLTMLSRLEIRSCTRLESLIGLHKLLVLHTLLIADCTTSLDLFIGSKFPPRLSSLAIHRCHKLRSLHLVMDNPSMLMELEISDCQGLMYIGNLNVFSDLESLKLVQCPLLQLQELCPAVPESAVIFRCPRLKKWCEIHCIEPQESLADSFALSSGLLTNIS